MVDLKDLYDHDMMTEKQGSVFGPLLFLVFINDLAFIIELACKLFADDTTLYATTTKSTDSLDTLIIDFVRKLNPLIEWCSMNRMDINWSKTFFMIVTAKHKNKLNIPATIKIGTNDVSVTDEFKLLGVLIFFNNLQIKYVQIK